MSEYIKGSGFSSEELEKMRGEFVSRYCESRGWDENHLTAEQLLEIREQREWKSPGLIKS